MTTARTIQPLIVKEVRVNYLGTFYLPSSAHMLKSQPQKTMLKKRRRSAVGILLSGLERIARDLHSYGTLPCEPLKPQLNLLRMPDVLPTLPLHRVSDSIVAAEASQVHIDCSFMLETIFTSVILGK